MHHVAPSGYKNVPVFNSIAHALELHSPYHHHSPAPTFAVLYNMTWVLGWTFEVDFAVEYAKKRKLCPEGTEDIDRLYHAAGFDITRRLGVPPQDVPVLACWDKDVLKAVYALCIDRRAKTLDQARVRPSQLPPRLVATKLAWLLDHHKPPRWYRYDGGRAYDEGSDCDDEGYIFDPDAESDEDEDGDGEDGEDVESEPRSPIEEHGRNAAINGMSVEAATEVQDTEATSKMKSLKIADLADEAVQFPKTA
ncbi:hypothetical protein OBBRIDRAFT_884147 [Obba rivulosa]|uniref:Uncharacterized protein n=1 Tax=Obba rivulosa TaxID=1052685 RepID=A0A8E2DTE8_9APHY|nr:hypothetical protein OBBRIDRAFT_884147 [Obba rivulosa]